MRKEEKQAYLETKSEGYYSGFGGLEVKEIRYGLNDAVVFCTGAWRGRPEIHTARIHYETERPYFLCRGLRVHFDEILRM